MAKSNDIWVPVMGATLLAVVGCAPTVRPAPAVVNCSAVASGKVVHLFPIEDWRTDDLGDRKMGEAIELDAGFSVRNLVLGAVVSSLDCMGFLPAEAGEGVPELRVAVVSIESTKGARLSDQPEAAPAPEPGAPESLPGYKPVKPALYVPGSQQLTFFPVSWSADDDLEYEYEEDEEDEEEPEQDVRSGLVVVVKAAFFHPPGELLLEREIRVTSYGPAPAPRDDAQANEQYARALGEMVTDALAAMGTQIVAMLASAPEMLATLPTVDDLVGLKQEPTEKKKKKTKAKKGSSGGKLAKTKTATEKDQLLWSAISKGKWDRATDLIDDGADPMTAVGIEGLTALHLVAMAGDLAALKTSIAGGAEVAVKADGGITALHLASRAGNLGVVKYLIKKGADPLGTDDLGYSALHHAAAGNKQSVVSYLVGTKGIDADADPAEALTPLMAAVLAGSLEMAKSLLAKGADPRQPSLDGLTPLHHAAATNSEKIAALLIAKGSEPDAKDAFLKTPLHHAVESCSETVSCLAVVEVLVEAGADPDAEDTDGKSPLDYAMYNDDAELMEFLAK